MQSPGTTTRRYLVDENLPHAQVLEEPNAGGVLQAQYAWDDDELLQHNWLNTSVTPNVGATSYHLADGLNSTRQLTDSSGAVTDVYTYDVWGADAGSVGNTPNVYRYNGQQRDNTALYYLRARYYSTGGRFLSHDPLMGDMQDPVSLHRYLYAGNDPVNYCDPSGAAPTTFFLDLGTDVHKFVGSDFERSLPGYRFFDRSFFTLFGIPWSVEGANLRPDLVDFASRRFFEIKSINQVAVGYSEIAVYQMLFTLFNWGGGWMPGEFNDYIPPFLTPPGQLRYGMQAVIFPPVGGLIVYKLINPRAAMVAIQLAILYNLAQEMAQGIMISAAEAAVVEAEVGMVVQTVPVGVSTVAAYEQADMNVGWGSALATGIL